MSPLVRLLYPLAARSRTPVAVIGWWERRRVTFNLVVGTSGLFSLGLVNMILGLPPLSGPVPGIPILPALAYGILANVLYSAGWGTELLFNAWWRKDPPEIGPVLFRQGLIFSVGLTLLPVAMAGLAWAAGFARWVLGW